MIDNRLVEGFVERHGAVPEMESVLPSSRLRRISLTRDPYPSFLQARWGGLDPLLAWEILRAFAKEPGRGDETQEEMEEVLKCSEQRPGDSAPVHALPRIELCGHMRQSQLQQRRSSGPARDS